MPTVLVTLLGGMQEPGHAAGSTLFALLLNPPMLDDVKSDLSTMLPKAISEGLRWMAPIGTQIRTAINDVELGGVTIPAGDTVSAVISSACHDENRFSNPTEYDLNRDEGNHSAFGFGPHVCAGRWFAQAQIEIALRTLLKRFPDLALDPNESVSFQRWEFRAPQTLPVTFSRPT